MKQSNSKRNLQAFAYGYPTIDFNLPNIKVNYGKK